MSDLADLDTEPSKAGPVSLRDQIASTYDVHAPGLYRYALVILADREAAEDAVQEAFTKLLAQRDRRTALDCAEAYLRTAVRNECYSMLRRRRHEPAASNGAGLLEAREPVACDEGERAAVERALLALPAEQREIVFLKAFEGWTFQEIATALGQSINTAASRYRYGIDKLRAQLTSEGYGQ